VATTATPERLRTFRGGDRDLEAPVDSLGRMRHRVVLDQRTISRADGDSGTASFRGHAAVFGKRTLIGGKRWGFWEQIEAGAFAKTIGEADVRFLINHDPNLLLARNKAGTLDLAEDDTGLATDAQLDTRQTYTSDVVIALERGDISQMSFAFEPIGWRIEELDDGKLLYTLTEVRLWDVSVVTYPAYEETDAGLRAAGFAALTRSLGLDAEAVLERLDAPDLGAYVARQIARLDGGNPGPAEPTPGTPSGPAETTRDDSPPAESTGTRTALRRRTLAARMDLHKEML
jgi:HK97 family phage prohead protease